MCSMFYVIDCSGAIEEESGCLVNCNKTSMYHKPPLVLEYDVGFCFDFLLLLLFNVAAVFDMIYDAIMF